MKKINETKSITELINSSLFENDFSKEKMNLTVKHSVIFSFWKDISGKKFSSLTKPYKIKSSKIYISAKSPVVIQELSLYKNKLIEKINSYSMPLGIEIKDIVFDYKNYNQLTNIKINEEYIEDKPVWYNKEELKNINSNEEEIIKKHIFGIKFLSDEQKKQFFEKISLANRAKVLRNKK